MFNFDDSVLKLLLNYFDNRKQCVKINNAFNFDDSVLKLLLNYFDNRKQCVKINNEFTCFTFFQKLLVCLLLFSWCTYFHQIFSF